jgi:general secretion pathway protein N
MRKLLLTFLALVLTFVLLLAFAPASWVAHSLARASGGRIVASEVHGLWWRGSMRVALTDPDNSRTAPMLLPGRVAWHLTGGRIAPPTALLAFEAPALAKEALRLELGIKGVSDVTIVVQKWQAQLPLALFQGFGAPWNTLGLTGTLLWQHEELSMESSTSRTNLRGRGTLYVLGAQSSVSPLRPLGSYRVQWNGEERGTQFNLFSEQGPLLLDGSGQMLAGKVRFEGTAKAAEGFEPALASLLAVIGRREGGVVRIRVSG